MFKALVAVLCAAVFASPAAATLTRNAALEQKAQQVLGSPHEVWCEENQAVWAENLGQAEGFTVYDKHYTLLSPNTCGYLLGERGENRDIATYIFLHELMHGAGIRVEADAECMALFLLRYEVRRWWGFTPQEARTAWAAAWRVHNGLAASYRGDCKPAPFDGVSLLNL